MRLHMPVVQKKVLRLFVDISLVTLGGCHISSGLGGFHQEMDLTQDGVRKT